MTDVVPEHYVLSGKVTGVHGVRGMLKVLVYSDHPELLLSFPHWYFKQSRGMTQFSLEKGQIYQEKGLLLKFKDIDSPETGRLWVGTELFLERSQLPALEKGYYWADLEGLAVYHINGLYLGQVSHLFETGANDVLVVKNEGKEILIPYVSGHVIIEVNLAEKKLVVDWEESDEV